MEKAITDVSAILPFYLHHTPGSPPLSINPSTSVPSPFPLASVFSLVPPLSHTQRCLWRLTHFSVQVWLESHVAHTLKATNAKKSRRRRKSKLPICWISAKKMVTESSQCLSPLLWSGWISLWLWDLWSIAHISIDSHFKQSDQYEVSGWRRRNKILALVNKKQPVPQRHLDYYHTQPDSNNKKKTAIPHLKEK